MPTSGEPAGADPSMRQPDIAVDGLSRGQLRLMVILITLAGAWLRLSHLGSKSLWLDEGATAALARASWAHFGWVWWHGEASLQTLYFLLMRGWIHLGTSETWLRLPSAIFGIAAIPLMYVLARKFMGALGALASAAVLAFSPTHVYFSQEARSYTLAMLVVMLSSYFFVEAVEGNRPRDWAWWAVMGVVAFYCHDFTALVLVAQVISLFLSSKRAAWGRVVVCGGIILLAAVPGLTYPLRASPENLHFAWMPRPSAKEFWHLAMFFGGAGAKVAVAAALWIAGVVAIWRNRRDEDARWRDELILVWAILPVVLLALVSVMQPMFLQRYLVFSLPAAVLLAGMGAEEWRKWRMGVLLAAVLCVMSVPTIRGEYSKPREDWRGVSNAILSQASPGDAVVFFPFYTRVMLDYYRDQRGGESADSAGVCAGILRGWRGCAGFVAGAGRTAARVSARVGSGWRGAAGWLRTRRRG